MKFILKEDIITCLTVVHPVEDDLWCSVPACHNITSHFTLCLSRQAKVQDLAKSNSVVGHIFLQFLYSRLFMLT